MKSWLKRLISTVLTLALLVSCFATLAFATEEDSAGTEGEGDSTLKPVVVYNRDFADGWELYNGLGSGASIMKDHAFGIDKETTSDYSYNYFVRFEAVDTVAAGRGVNETDGFADLSFSGQNYPAENHVFVEFDIKIDDLCNLGTILYTRTEGGSSSGTLATILSIVDGRLRVFPHDSQHKSHEGYDIADKWTHIVVDFDYTNESYDPKQSFDIHVTVGDNEPLSVKVDAKTYGKTGIDIFRFGLSAVKTAEESTARAGQSWCFDNLQAYCNTDRRLTEEEINAQGYGTGVNVNQAQTVRIEGSGESKTTQDYLNESLCMKVGVNYALNNGEQVNIFDGTYGAPVEYEGKIIVPFDIILDYMGTGYFVHEDGKSYDISTGVSATYLTMGRDLATVNGKVVALTMAPGYYTDEATGNKYAVVALDDIEQLLPGYYVTYDSMGLIVIGKIDEILNRETDLDQMLDLMNRFIYNFVDAETIYEDVKETTNDFTHPYLLADQSVFDKITAIWNGTDTKEYDVDLKYYISKQVTRAYTLYERMALPDPLLDENGEVVTDEEGNTVYGDTYNEYHGLDWSRSYTQLLIYPHVATNGYDPAGGRQGESTTTLGYAQDIAFGYAVTGDIKLAQLVYDILVELGNWNHWGPGHFLNVADASQRFAIAFDWTYNGIAALEAGEYDGEVEQLNGKAASEYYSIDYVEQLLYKNGVRMGYLMSTNQDHGWKRNQGNVCYYTVMENNWNAVCTCGMWLASLVLLGSDQVGVLGTNEGEAPVADTAAWLIANNIETLAVNGMSQYAPDGSYVESPGYWGYGTNALYLGLMALWSCTGDDYGYFDAPGMDKTCYFACNVESSDYVQFAYHDASMNASVDSCSFYFVAEATNDPVLAEIRKLHNNNGKGMNYRDFLFYPYDEEDSAEDVVLSLDYYMEGIDAFTTRSSWEPGALFAGIIAGDNNASHGQVDSGTFVYHNAGTVWLLDLGSDEYNIYHYFTSPDRYRYYRMNAEGHNVVALTSQPTAVPYGQKLNAAGDLTNWFSNDFGSYAIVDNTEVYGGYATSARRGMLLTNDRKTLVIQDEINLEGVETLYWLAHFDDSELDFEVAANGRTMYLYKKDSRGNVEQILRLSIVSRTAYEKFVITTAGETAEDRLLKGDKGTVDYSWSTANGALVSEKSRADYKRITVKANTNTMQMAVVIELIENKNDPLGYSTLVPMNEWVPTGTSDSVDTPDKDKTEYRPLAKLANIRSYMRDARNIVELGRQYTTKLDDYYYALTYVYYTYRQFYPEDLAAYTTDLEDFDRLKAEYDEYIGRVNGSITSARSLAQGLMGI